MKFLRQMIEISLLIASLQISGSQCDNAVMFSKPLADKSWEDEFCINYNPYFQDLPQHEGEATSYKIADLSSSLGCNQSDFNRVNVSQSVVIVARGNCTFTEKALNAQNAGAKAVIIASDELITPAAQNASTDYKNINITVATALWENIDKIKSDGPNQVAILFSPQLERPFDPNLAVIFIIAVSNIAIGGCWAGLTKHAKYQRLKYKHKREETAAQGQRGSSDEEPLSDTEDEETVDVSVILIVIFFVLVCGFLILLYFFYDYLVYVVIALFVIAGSLGLYYCLMPLWHKICPFKARFPKNRIPMFRGRPYYRDLLLLAVCFGVGIFWGFERHAPYAWVIQDILGYAFCINVMKSVGVPNMKVCTVLLVLLFVYDIFFVFITPLFTKSGESVMVKVATGGGSKTNEHLPMVFLVPRLTRDVISLCPLSKSLLGFGDIIIPGLLVSHNHAFDLRVQSRRVYYIATCVGYALGLVITFVALALMESGQPALLYLVPCTLIPTYGLGCIRGEVRMLWNGVKDSDLEQNNSREAPTGDLDSVPTTVSNSRATVDSNSTTSSADNENRELLKK